MNSLPAAKPPVPGFTKTSNGSYAMHRFIAEQDQYKRFLVTGPHSSKGGGWQNVHGGSQGVPLHLPQQQRSKSSSDQMGVVSALKSKSDGPRI